MTAFQAQAHTEYSVSLSFGSSIDEDILANIIAIHQELNETPFLGFIESVPTYTSLTIYFNPAVVMQSVMPGSTSSEKVITYLERYEWRGFLKTSTEKTIHIPVCYDESFGIDLSDLSKELGLTPIELIQLHSQKIYTVYMVGFTPGFPYMGTLDSGLTCKRKQTPRKEVAAGSVGIAGKQTGVYPSATPGGWQIIGRTPLDFFSTDNNPPALLQAGDKVKFNSISLHEFNQLKRK